MLSTRIPGRFDRRSLHALSAAAAVAALAWLVSGECSALEVPLSEDAVRPEQVTPLGAAAIFVSRALDGRHTIWWSDGTSQATHFVVDPCPSPCDGQSAIKILGSTNEGLAFFYAKDPSISPFVWNLWRTDGTPAGTYTLLQASQVASVDLLSAEAYAVTGSRIVFRRSAPGDFIWVSDGSVAGTGPLEGLPEARLGDQAEVCAGDAIAAYIRLSIFSEGSRFYRTDGTPVGTSAPISIPDPSGSCFRSVVSGGEFWVPSWQAPPAELGLWTTDGSVSGTTFSGPLPGNPWPIEVRSGRALAIVRDEEGGAGSLWVSDGTPAGTRLLKQGTSWESFEYGYTAQMFEIVEPFAYYLYLNDDGALEVRRVRLDGTDDRLIQTACLSNCGYESEYSWVESVGGRLVFPAETASEDVQLFQLEPPATVAARVETPCGAFCYVPLGFHQVIGPRLVFDYRGDIEGLELLVFGPSAGPARRISDFAAITPFLFDNSTAPLVLAGRHLLLPAGELNTETQLLYSLPAFDVCTASSAYLCLRAARFRVEVHWRDFTGRRGSGHARPLTTDTGYFWFFDDANVELTVKVVDGTGFNGYYWVYYGALSNVEYWITVEDTVTGESKQYHNALGQFGSFGDIEALPAEPGNLGIPATAPTVSPTAVVTEFAAPALARLARADFGSSGSCIPSASSLCLLDGRFEVEAAWTDFAGHSGIAYVQQLTPDTGYFWFFDEANVEVVAKLVDGYAFNQHFWVYYGALSNVEYTLTVTDTVAGGPPKIYRNALGEFGSFGDIQAFPAP